MRGYCEGTPRRAIPLADARGKPARCHCPFRIWLWVGSEKPTKARAVGHHNFRVG